MKDTSAEYSDQALEATLDEASITMLGAAKPPGITTKDLSGIGFTYRHNWGARNGFWRLRLNTTSVGPNTRVFVAASEGPTADGGKLVGDAKYLVYNVAPENGAVTIRVHVDWTSPIGLVVDYLIVNP
ncbi:hypothetical protein AB0I81_38685 [Nonomuraea sp. NPDC050404]|uniref:hypothetical protein n=1 Tax=Nonomuraea sp. NPDC050404 TaxID=3155783 RepID=UPI0033E5EB5F